MSQTSDRIRVEWKRNDAFELGHVFHVNQKYADAHICNDNECAFFRKYMK